jgi:Uma2 family endonuclease
MLARADEPWTFETYMAWEAEQDEKWEFVDGRPVRRSERWWKDPVTGMAGARLRHNRISANIIRHLGNRLAGGQCFPLPSDQLVRSSTGSGRYPDVTVDCGTSTSDSVLANEPRVLFEVLSPSNTVRQQMRLVADYQAMASVQQVIFIEQDKVGALIWTRNADGWRAAEVDGLDVVLSLPSLGVELPLAEVYEGLTFDPAPTDA